MQTLDDKLLQDEEIAERLMASGRAIGLPVRYRSTTAMVAHFPAPAKLVRSLLPTPKLVPALFLPGTAIISVAALEYRDISDVEAYNEVSIMIPVQYRPAINVPGLPLLFHNRFNTFGFYILHLPVTTQEAMDFGIEFWGYPKFVANIDFRETERSRDCTLLVDNAEVLTLSIPRSSVGRHRKSYHTYTQYNGSLIRTRVSTDERSVTKRIISGARLSLGDHAISQQLRECRVAASAVEHSYAPEANSLLYAHEQEFPL